MFGQDARLARELSLLSSLESRYEKFELVGSGNVGFVYKAYDNVLGRWVAVKSLHEGASEKKYLRFQSEARALSKLNHINIVKVLDFGITQRNELYLILDFVEGPSLETFLLENGAMDVEAAISLFVQICNGMAHAHHQGVIHRDLKPSNIMLAEPQLELAKSEIPPTVVRIVDFGLAVYTSKTSQDDLKRNTTTGGIAGSPNYISPEQIKEMEVTERSDIYSLGCIMFECLSGHPPFEREALMEVYRGHLESTPPALDELVPALSEYPGLVQIVETALSKRPEDRFNCMKALADQLIEFVPERSRVLLKRSDENPTLILSLKGNKKESLRWLWIAVSSVTLVLVGIIAVMVVKLPRSEDVEIKPDSTMGEALDFSDRKAGAPIWSRGYHREIGKYVFFSDPNHTTDESLKELQAVNFQRLSLIANPVDGSGLRYLHGKNINALALSYSGVNDSTIHNLNGLPGLQRLWLTGTRLSAKGLSKLNVFPEMRVLLLNECVNVDDQGVAASIKAFPNLKELSIGSTGITAKGLAMLKDLKHLEKLSLIALNLKDEQLDQLQGSSIRNLDISRNPELTDRSIINLKRFPALDLLRLSGCSGVSSIGIGKLKAGYKKRKFQVFAPDTPKFSSNEAFSGYLDSRGYKPDERKNSSGK